MSTSCTDDNCVLIAVRVSDSVVNSSVSMDWVLPSTPASWAMAEIAPCRLDVVFWINPVKFGSFCCELVSDPTVANADIRSRMYEPVVKVPVEVT